MTSLLEMLVCVFYPAAVDICSELRLHRSTRARAARAGLGRWAAAAPCWKRPLLASLSNGSQQIHFFTVIGSGARPKMLSTSARGLAAGAGLDYTPLGTGALFFGAIFGLICKYVVFLVLSNLKASV
jgi:hypothetical protein